MNRGRLRISNASVFLYSSAFAIGCGGLAYGLVPLYKLICQTTGITGAPQVQNALDIDRIQPIAGVNPIQIKFVANRSKGLPWVFQPLQQSVSVVPGQTALAFYNAKNLSSRDVVGLATYNIVPARAALYFNKVQCFCFERQRLRPGEEVDMPVFFYIDPDFAIDPLLKNTKEIFLSYTFFEANQ